MREFKKRRSRRGELLYLLQRTGIVVFLLGATFFAIKGAWGMYGKFQEATIGERGAEARLAALQMQTTHVTQSVDALSSPLGVEAAIREQYGMAKPGEGEIDIVTETATTASTPPPPPRGWENLWQALFVW